MRDLSSAWGRIALPRTNGGPVILRWIETEPIFQSAVFVSLRQRKGNGHPRPSPQGSACCGASLRRAAFGPFLLMALGGIDYKKACGGRGE